MARGQAFETMMLVISVVVALAILGVLMSIIGGIGPIGTGNPEESLKSSFRDLHAGGGVGISTPKKVQFKKGDDILVDFVSAQVPSIQKSDIKFVCVSGADICDGTPLTVTDDEISAKGDIEVNLVTCANEANDGALYCAAVGPSVEEEETRDACKEACGLGR